MVEPNLFNRVTGLTVKDFELLVSLNVFNESLMNDAVYKFKRYEDSSLGYIGIDMHAEDERVGLFSTSITKEEYLAMSGLTEKSMTTPARQITDIPISNSRASVTNTVPIGYAPSSSYLEKINSNQSTKKNIPKVDLNRVKKGIRVRHKAFGDGVVLNIKNDFVKVKFDKDNIEKNLH